jgi:hypothetical protein
VFLLILTYGSGVSRMILLITHLHANNWLPGFSARPQDFQNGQTSQASGHYSVSGRTKIVLTKQFLCWFSIQRSCWILSPIHFENTAKFILQHCTNSQGWINCQWQITLDGFINQLYTVLTDEYCDMTPESRNNWARRNRPLLGNGSINIRDNGYARNNNSTSQ